MASMSGKGSRSLYATPELSAMVAEDLLLESVTSKHCETAVWRMCCWDERSKHERVLRHMQRVIVRCKNQIRSGCGLTAPIRSTFRRGVYVRKMFVHIGSYYKAII